MIEFTEGKGVGQWFKPKTSEHGLKVWFKCPKCRHLRAISKHEIKLDGTVSPSVVCSCGCGCKFHDYVKLIGWE